MVGLIDGSFRVRSVAGAAIILVLGVEKVVHQGYKQLMKDNHFWDNNIFYVCPKCSKNSLVKKRDDLYQCLWCDFRKDVSRGNDNLAIVILALMGVFLLLLLLS